MAKEKMNASLYQKVRTQPLISVTSPRETNKRTIFFPSRGKAVMPSQPHKRTDIVNVTSRAVNPKNNSVLPSVKSDMKRSDLCYLYITDDYVPNKDNLGDYEDRKRHVITRTRHGLIPQNTNREFDHVWPYSVNMSGGQAKVKKHLIASGSLRAQGRDGKQSLTKTRDEKSTSSSGRKHDGNTHASPGLSGALDVRSTKISPKERPSRHSVNGQGFRRHEDTKAEKVKSKTDPLPLVNHALLQVNDSERRGGEHSRRTSPSSSLAKITEESFIEDERRSVNHSALKANGQGKGRSARTPRKVRANASPSAHSRSNDREDVVQEMELPKVTMNEVLQSWNVGASPRTRSSSFGGKDPMEFLLTKESSDSNTKQKTATIEDLRTCRYLRTGAKGDHETHSQLCSCNSCEHGQGLKSTPYLNS